MATYAAASASVADVTTALGLATHGDVVEIPPSTATWASGIATTKRVRIKAAISGTVTLTHGAGTATLLAMTTGNDHSVHVSGLRFLPGTGTGSYLEFTGTGSKVPLVDRCTFNVPDFQLTNAIEWSTTGGVCWLTTFESTEVNGTSGSNGSGSGCIRHYSNKPWLDAATWGTADTTGTAKLYFEDCTFINIYNQCIDGDDNSRFVVRYSTVRNTQFLTHGTTSLQGGREVELYNNSFEYRTHAANGSGITSVNLNRYFWCRAGTMRVTDNSFEAITSSDWGTKTALMFICESLTRPGSGAACQISYPGTHWPGQGANGSAQVSDPVHIWNNTGTVTVGTNDQTDECGNGLLTEDFFLQDRDYFLSAPSGYTKFEYPHPLRTEADGGGSGPTSGLSSYAENVALDALFGSGSPATLYLALFTAAPSDAGGGTEVSGSGYARKAVTNNSTNFPAASSGSKALNVAQSFVASTGSWGTVTHWGLFDSSTGGNLVAWGALTTPRAVGTANTVTIPAASLALTLD